MRTPTRSPTPCASRSRRCANGLANPGSSPPWLAPGTASVLNQTPGVREETVDRAPGLSVRLKLTLSYAGFLMLAGALLLATVWVFLLRYVPDGVLITPGAAETSTDAAFPSLPLPPLPQRERGRSSLGCGLAPLPLGWGGAGGDGEGRPCSSPVITPRFIPNRSDL